MAEMKPCPHDPRTLCTMQSSCEGCDDNPNEQNCYTCADIYVESIDCHECYSIKEKKYTNWKPLN